MNRSFVKCKFKTDSNNLNFHFHNSYEMIFVTKGAAKLNINGTNLYVNKGDFIFLNNQAYHNITILTPPYERYVATIETKPFEKNLEQELLLSLKHQIIERGGKIHINSLFEISNLFDKIIQEFNANDIGSNTLIASYINQIVVYFLRFSNFNNASSENILDKILEVERILEKNFQKNIKIQDICAELFISHHYLTHKFKEYTGISPKQYLMQIRLNNAGKLLSENALSIGEIAQRSGFNDTANFIRLFKRHFGVSPKVFRNTSN